MFNFSRILSVFKKRRDAVDPEFLNFESDIVKTLQEMKHSKSYKLTEAEINVDTLTYEPLRPREGESTSHFILRSAIHEKKRKELYDQKNGDWDSEPDVPNTLKETEDCYEYCCPTASEKPLISDFTKPFRYNDRESSDDGYEDDNEITNESQGETGESSENEETIIIKDNLLKKISQARCGTAERDYLAGEWLLEGEFYPQAVLLFQQAHEKALKSILLLTIETERYQRLSNTHDLSYLMTQLPNYLKYDPDIKRSGYCMEQLGLGNNSPKFSSVCIRARYESQATENALQTIPDLKFGEDEGQLAKQYSSAFLRRVLDLEFLK